MPPWAQLCVSYIEAGCACLSPRPQAALREAGLVKATKREPPFPVWGRQGNDQHEVPGDPDAVTPCHH